jgi:hypothetical protein
MYSIIKLQSHFRRLIAKRRVNLLRIEKRKRDMAEQLRREEAERFSREEAERLHRVST